MIMTPMAIMMIADEDDRSFVERLFIENRYLLFKTAYRIVESPMAAEDMVSETCAIMCDKIDYLRAISDCKRRSYIVSIVRNASLDYVRKRNRQNRKSFLVSDEKIFDAQEQEVEIDNGLIREAEHEALRLALSRMNERDKELLVMKYYDELSNDEIAERNGTSEACVRANLSKARRRLRKLLEEGD